MSLLTITQELARDVGLAVPTQVVGSADRSMSELLSFANAAGEELARRVDWGQLKATATLVGDGTQIAHAMPAGFARVIPGAAVTTPTGGIVRPLTQAEWGSLVPMVGDPRYFLLDQNKVTLWPHLATAATVSVRYQTKNWCSNGGSAFTADDQTALMDESLFAKALIVRWRRQKGMDYADYEAEFEAALADFARFNDRSRL